MGTLPQDLLDTIRNSSNTILQSEFKNLTDETSSSSARLQKRQRRGSLVQQTVSTKFRNQLTALMNTISQTKTRYIRCIKPNSLKKPRILDHKSTVVQLRSAGVVDAMSISRASFPNRPRLEVAWHRFSSLVSKKVLHEACACHAVGNEKKEDFSSTKVTVNLKVNYLLEILLKGMKSSENNYISTCTVTII